MIFGDGLHRQAFHEAAKKQEEKNYELLAALYLLTADEKVWNCAKDKVRKGRIFFEEIRIGSVSEESYCLYAAAKDIYLGSENIRLRDLGNRNMMNQTVYSQIMTAVSLCRFGIAVIRIGETNEKRQQKTARTARAVSKGKQS